MKRAVRAWSAVLLCISAMQAWSQESAQRPNILLILADDLGYTDLGAFGGEIATPNLDALAAAGTRLSNFHTAPACAPSRAMLLTGTDNHVAGMGAQPGLATPAQMESRQYLGALLPEVPTLMEQLRDAGYHTIASAKWHLGNQAPHTPKARGFDRSFVLLQGGAGHFDSTPALEHYGQARWLEDDEPFPLPEDFYSTDFMTDKLLQYLEETPDDQPWFAYLGYTAPHWPLQAPAETLAKYEEDYFEGWDELRAQRLRGAIDAGLLPEGTSSVDTEPRSRSWASLAPEEQRLQARRMQVYAAMIDRMDQNIGRVLEALRARGEDDNTLILFLSDNGAASEDMERVNPAHEQWVRDTFDNSFSSMGSRHSYISIGTSWARAIISAFRDSKAKLAEGGIRVPAILRLPGSMRQESFAGAIHRDYQHIMDLAPTFLALAGAEAPDSMRGRSLLPQWLAGKPSYIEGTTIAAETFGRRMARRGDWKALHQSPPWGTGEWQLYNLATDAGEQNDLALQHPDLLKELVDAYRDYAADVGVVELKKALPF